MSSKRKIIQPIKCKCSTPTLGTFSVSKTPKIEKKIKNPRTNRMITIGGKLYNKLKKENIL